MPEKKKFVVLCDTGEKTPWKFNRSENCAGSVKKNLYTADYSLDGLYDNKIFALERKGSPSELASNLTDKERWDDFRQELERLEEFVHPFVICEFPYSLVESYPMGSGVPKKLWGSLRVSGRFFAKRVWEVQLAYKTKFVFAGASAKEAALSLFKRVAEKYPECLPPN